MQVMILLPLPPYDPLSTLDRHRRLLVAGVTAIASVQIHALVDYRPFTPGLSWSRRYRGLVDFLGSLASWFRLRWFVGLAFADIFIDTVNSRMALSSYGRKVGETEPMYSFGLAL
ncbi:hypothetical protein NMY22_g271 [Coprinellus aureogranulatus]|nr:hypothetical protein NMY22_g271 [Coprinellus aureogranulatus]